MTHARERTIRCTVHWFDGEQTRMHDVAFADRPAGELAATLRDCLDLPRAGASQLRHAPLLPAWPVNQTLAELGIRDGSHIWFVPDPPRSTLPAPLQTQHHYTCAVVLPHGQEVPIGSQGQDISRAWLLQQMPWWRRGWEWLRSALLRSPYDYVTDDEPHCYVRPLGNGDWAFGPHTTRWPTLHNNTLVSPGLTRALVNGDQLTLGDELRLRVVLRPHDGPLSHHKELAGCPYGRLEVLNGQHCAQQWAVEPDLIVGGDNCAASLRDPIMNGARLRFDRDAHFQTVVNYSGTTPAHVYRPTTHGLNIEYGVYALARDPFPLQRGDLLVIGDPHHVGDEHYAVQIRFEHPWF